MANLSSLEKRQFESLLGMNSGYVLDFSDASFADMFRTTCKIDINAPKYCKAGGSKAKRLRSFWDIEDNKTVGLALMEMMKVWKHIQAQKKESTDSADFQACKKAVGRLLGIESNAKRESASEEEFLRTKFEEANLEKLDVDPKLAVVLKARLDEALICHTSGAPLSTIIMCGSLLEGILLGIAMRNQEKFNRSPCCPMTEGRPKQFGDWKLSEFIDVAHNLEILSLDVKKFSHSLRDFRNYIHPNAQMSSGFTPTEHTAEICLQVLKAAIYSAIESPIEKSDKAER